MAPRMDTTVYMRASALSGRGRFATTGEKMLDTTTALGRTLQEIAEAHGFSGAAELVGAANHEDRPMEDFPWMGFGSDLESVIGFDGEEKTRIVKAFAQTYLGLPAEEGSPAPSSTTGAGEDAFPIGSKERPDAGGIVRRGKAVRFMGYVERYGEPPVCFFGGYGEEARSMAPPACERPAAMEVYGLHMCELHGEEAASGALEEIAYDLENELQRPLNGYVRPLSPHLERALRHGFETLPDGANESERREEALLEAFPFDRSRADADTLSYAENPDASTHSGRQSPYDSFLGDRLLVCRHMRLAFEEDADWLVEMLEREREVVAAQAAYALALDREAEDRPAG